MKPMNKVEKKIREIVWEVWSDGFYSEDSITPIDNLINEAVSKLVALYQPQEGKLTNGHLPGCPCEECLPVEKKEDRASKARCDNCYKHHLCKEFRLLSGECSECGKVIPEPAPSAEALPLKRVGVLSWGVPLIEALVSSPMPCDVDNKTFNSGYACGIRYAIQCYEEFNKGVS